MRKRRKGLIQKVLITLMMILSMSFTIFAGPPGEEFNASEGESLSFLEDTTKVLYEASDGKLYKADPKDLFKYLKQTYGDEEYVQDTSMKWKDVDSTGDGIDSMIFGNQVTNNYQSYLISSTVGAILKVTTEDLQAVVKYYDFIGPIAFTLCLLYALLDLMNKSAAELQSKESLIFMFLKFAIGVFFVSVSPQIAEMTYNLSNAALAQFLSAGTSSVLTAQSEADLIEIAMRCDASSVLSSFTSLISSLSNSYVFALLGTLAILIITVMCYARKLEMGIRTVFLPIALADISGSGTTGRGMGYMRKMISLALQAAGIVFVCKLGTDLAVGQASPLGMGTIIPFAMVGSIPTVKKILDEAAGG